MATYIPQIQGYIPQYQPFQPDFNFYAGALQMKQSQYDAAHKQLSTLYTSLLNSPLTRDGNVKKRDEIFAMINQDIKKISSVDLSLAENVSAARKVFDPIYQDDNIVKDMVWTKNWMKALNTADSYKGCTDPKKCNGQFWETGLQELYYKRDEFKNASDKDALTFGDVEFTPYVNVHEKAVALAKEAGLKVKQDFNTGQWIITKQNGDLVTGGLYNLFSNALGGDPQIQAMYRSGAYVKRKSYIDEKASEFGSKEAAEMSYINSILATGNSSVDKQKTNVNNASDQMATRRIELLEKQRSSGLTYEELNALKEIEEKYPQLQNTKENLQTVTNTINNKTSDDINSLRSRADAAAAHVLASYDFTTAAQTLALKDAEITMKENPYAMATHQADLSLRNSKEMARVNYENKMNEMIFKNKLDMGRDQFKYMLENGYYDDSFINPGSTQGGAGTPTTISDASYANAQLKKGEENQDVVYKKNVETANKLKNNVLDNQISFLQSVYAAANNTKSPGSSQAIQQIFGQSLGQKGGRYPNTAEGVKKLLNDLKAQPALIDGYYQKAVQQLTSKCPTCDKTWANAFLKDNNAILSINKIDEQKKAEVAVRNKITKDIQDVVTSLNGQKVKDADLMLKNGYLSDKESFVQAYIKRHKNDADFNPQVNSAFSLDNLKRFVPDWLGGKSSQGVMTEGLGQRYDAENISYFNKMYAKTGDKDWLAKKNAYVAQRKNERSNSPVLEAFGGQSRNVKVDLEEAANQAFENLNTAVFTAFNNKKGAPLDQGYNLKGGGMLSGDVLVYNNVDGAKIYAGPTMNARQDMTTFANNISKFGTENYHITFGDPTKANINAHDDAETQAALKIALATLNADLNKRWKHGDKSRPMFTYKMSKIAANNENLSSRTIILDEGYRKKLIGSEKNKGPLYNYKDYLTEGISFIYDNKDMRLGGDMASEATNLDYIAKYHPEGVKINIPNGGTVSIKVDNNGELRTEGSTFRYINGEKLEVGYTHPSDARGASIEDIRDEVTNRLMKIKESNDQLDMEAQYYNAAGYSVKGYHPPVTTP